jgi:hypothetical protein
MRVSLLLDLPPNPIALLAGPARWLWIVCLSAAAYEQVRGKLDLAVADMGEQDLKNIARPLRTYRVVL